jgi:hypothetical protein
MSSVVAIYHVAIYVAGTTCVVQRSDRLALQRVSCFRLDNSAKDAIHLSRFVARPDSTERASFRIAVQPVVRYTTGMQSGKLLRGRGEMWEMLQIALS